MPLEIRTLIFIFAFVAGPFYLFYRYSFSLGLTREIKNWIIVWSGMTVMAFLSPNFWIYSAFLAIWVTYFAGPDPIRRICLFFVLLPSMSAATVSIPGFGLINYLFSIGHPHVLILVLLAPLLLRKSHGLNVNRGFHLIFFSYFALNVLIGLRDQNITELLRSATVLTIVMLIPFFAISKTIKTLDDFKKVMLAIAFGIILQATIGIAETVKNWHLYNAAEIALGIDWGYGTYLSRNNLLRASAALGHPIVLGYVCVIGIGMFMHFYSSEKRSANRIYWIFMILLSGGLVSTLSRGPWVGAALTILVFILTGPKAGSKIAKLGAGGVLALIMLSMSPAGKNFIDLIPFVSSDEQNHAVSTISYRQRLMEQSWIVIKRNPILGSATFLETPEMETMRQGEGIIDVVNSYLSVTLGSGFVGLTFFVAIFLIPAYRLYKLLPTFRRNVRFKEWIRYNRALLATILGIMLTIFTASSIGVIAIYYWSIIGIACAFIKAARTEMLDHIMNMSATAKPAHM